MALPGQTEPGLSAERSRDGRKASRRESPGSSAANINRLHGELCSALVSRKDGQRSTEVREVASTRVQGSRSY